MLGGPCIGHRLKVHQRSWFNLGGFLVPTSRLPAQWLFMVQPLTLGSRCYLEMVAIWKCLDPQRSGSSSLLTLHSSACGRLQRGSVFFTAFARGQQILQKWVVGLECAIQYAGKTRTAFQGTGPGHRPFLTGQTPTLAIIWDQLSLRSGLPCLT